MSHLILWGAVLTSMLYTGRDQGAPSVQLAMRGLDMLKEGQVERAEQMFTDALKVAQKGQHPRGEGMAALCLSNMYWGMGLTSPPVRDFARKAYEIFAQQASIDQRHNEAIAAFNLGLIHQFIGDHVEAINKYYIARQVLVTAYQHWVAYKEQKQAYRCFQLGKWIEHLMERLVGSAPDERKVSFFIPIEIKNHGTAILWSDNLRVVSVLIDRSTFQVNPLQEFLVLTADCCVFPIPDPAHQPIQEEIGKDGEYILARKEAPIPERTFYVMETNGDFDFVHIDFVLGKDSIQYIITIKSITTARTIGVEYLSRALLTYRPLAFLTR